MSLDLPGDWKDKEEKEFTGKKKEIILLLDKSARNKSELSQELDCSRPTIYTHIKPLIKKKWVEEKGNKLVLNKDRVEISRLNNRALQNITTSGYERAGILVSFLSFISYVMFITYNSRYVSIFDIILTYCIAIAPILISKLIMLYFKSEYTRVVGR